MCSRSHCGQVLVWGILIGTSCVAVAIHMVARNEFWAFLAGDYIGGWYFGFLAAVSLFLGDVAWNRARLTGIITGIIVRFFRSTP